MEGVFEKPLPKSFFLSGKTTKSHEYEDVFKTDTARSYRSRRSGQQRRSECKDAAESILESSLGGQGEAQLSARFEEFPGYISKEEWNKIKTVLETTLTSSLTIMKEPLMSAPLEKEKSVAELQSTVTSELPERANSQYSAWESTSIEMDKPQHQGSGDSTVIREKTKTPTILPLLSVCEHDGSSLVSRECRSVTLKKPDRSLNTFLRKSRKVLQRALERKIIATLAASWLRIREEKNYIENILSHPYLKNGEETVRSFQEEFKKVSSEVKEMFQTKSTGWIEYEAKLRSLESEIEAKRKERERVSEEAKLVRRTLDSLLERSRGIK